MRKHMRDQRPWMGDTPNQIIRQVQVLHDMAEDPGLRIKAGSQRDRQLHQHHGYKYRHIDNDQSGDRIAGLELVLNIVNDRS